MSAPSSVQPQMEDLSTTWLVRAGVIPDMLASPILALHYVPIMGPEHLDSIHLLAPWEPEI